MRRALLILFAAASMHAQTISPELSYGPYRRPDRGIDHAVAAAHRGALLAWSEIGADSGYARIHLGILNDDAQLISPITVLPIPPGDREDVAPAVASDGRSFFVAYVERIRGRELQLMGVTVDAFGTASAPRAYGPAVSINVAPPPTTQVVWDGTSYHVLGVGQAFAVARDGTILGPSTFKTGTAVNPATGIVASVSIQSQLTCFWYCLYGRSTQYNLAWTAGTKSGSVYIGLNDAPGTPAIAVSGDRFVVAWTRLQYVQYFVLGDGINTVWADPAFTMTTGFDCDDEQCVLAYATARGDVHALAFPVDRLQGPLMLPVATTERTEGAQQVHALGHGRFLVSYQSNGSTDQRLNGRVIALESSKRRSMH